MRKSVAASGTMTLGARLKSLREKTGMSHKEIGAQGLVSTHQWIKIENGQRSASDALLVRFAGWLFRNKFVEASTAGRITEELLTLKHLGNRSAFVRRLVRDHAAQLFEGTPISVSEEPWAYRTKSRRNSPATKGKRTTDGPE